MSELDPSLIRNTARLVPGIMAGRYVEDFGNADQVYVERDGKKLMYADLVKEVETA